MTKPNTPRKCRKWPQAATDLCIRLRRQSRTSGQIVEALAEEGFRVSREAVCGKLHRLKEAGVDLGPPPKRNLPPTRYTAPTLSTGVVLGTFLERLCDVSTW